jgi:hypothetical protein
MSDQLSPLLKTLLKYLKVEEPSFEWRDVAAALAETYHPNMRYFDVFKLVVKAHQEAECEPRFEMPRTRREDLLLAPLKGSFSVCGFFGPQTMEDSYPLRDIYRAFFSHMLSDLRLTRVDWCNDQLGE